MTQNTITLDDVTYDLSEFSQDIRDAVKIYESFNMDLTKAQVALNSVSHQITQAVRKELAEKEAAKPQSGD